MKDKKHKDNYNKAHYNQLLMMSDKKINLKNIK